VFLAFGSFTTSEETDPLGLLAVQIDRHLVALPLRRRAIAGDRGADADELGADYARKTEWHEAQRHGASLCRA